MALESLLDSYCLVETLTAAPKDWKWVAWKARFCFVKRLVAKPGEVLADWEQLATSASSVIDFQATPTWPSSSSADESASTANIACCAEILAVMDDSERASSDVAAMSAASVPASFG